MKLYIPEIGDTITLSKNWKFTLHAEYRNEDFSNHLGYKFSWETIILNPNTNKYRLYDFGMEGRLKTQDTNYCHQHFSDENGERFPSVEITLKKGTELKIDRIYIRKGNSEYSSITFYAKLPNEKKKYRFWAKLEDVNKIEFK